MVSPFSHINLAASCSVCYSQARNRVFGASMTSSGRSLHELKRYVFKNNYTRLRECFKSTGVSIKCFLYSKDIINAETRDTHDMDKVLADVEMKLKYTETTWDILLIGMAEPPLDVLCSYLRKELETELFRENAKAPEHHQDIVFPSTSNNYPSTSRDVPTTLQLDSFERPKPTPKDSGCGSTSMLEYRNYPDNYFPPRETLPGTNTNASPSTVNSGVSPLSGDSVVVSPLSASSNVTPPSVNSSTPSVNSRSSAPPLVNPSVSPAKSSAPPLVTSSVPPTLPLKSLSSDSHESTYSSSTNSISVANSAATSPGTRLTSDSGYEAFESPLEKSPVSFQPIPATHYHHTNNSVSELVNPLRTSKLPEADYIDGSDNGSSSLYRKIATLETENNSLRITKKEIIDQIKKLEEEHNHLMEIRKEDQQLLEFKMHQVAQENEILEKKQERIRRLESENRELKRELNTSMSQQQLLKERNEELMYSVRLAERSTSLSAITIDHLKQEIASRDNVIQELQGELLHYREWYRTIHEPKENTPEPSENYLSESRLETR